MSKNITIKEGAVAKNFTGVKKINTNQMGSGSVSWIPEDEAADYCTFKTITARKNGTYKAEDNACDGFSEVKVEVPADVKDKVITTNGEYIAAEDNCLGYRKVTVNVSGGGSGSGQHTVIFYAADRTTILERVTVEDGGGAAFHQPLPTASGMRFIGWSPNPVNVRADMNVYPRFENISYDPMQIQDDWITIAQKVRQNPNAYQIGQWKLLELNGLLASDFNAITQKARSTQKNVDIPASAIKMVLVGKGVDLLEGGNGYAPTTWVGGSLLGWDVCMYDEDALGTDGTTVYNWGRTYLRAFLQDQFSSLIFPRDLLNYVRRIIKYSVSAYAETQVLATDDPTIDWFFVPSVQEVFGGCTDFLSEIAVHENMCPVYDIFGKDDTVANTVAQRILLRNMIETAPDTWLLRTKDNLNVAPGWGSWCQNYQAVNQYGQRAGNNTAVHPLNFGFCL